MAKTGQIKRCQGLDKLGRNVAPKHNHPKIFKKLIAFQKTTVLSRNEISLREKQTFYYCFYNYS